MGDGSTPATRLVLPAPALRGKQNEFGHQVLLKWWYARERSARDYHLGFMTDEQAERYPVHVHALSPMLTLQGAGAHFDMPVESGPTMLLPHSH